MVDFSEEDYLQVSNYIGIIAPKFSATGNMGMFGPIDSDEPHSNDEVLTGDQSEVFTLPNAPEGVGLFWSITPYSALTRNTLPGNNDLYNAYNTEPDENGNITVTFSAEDPNDGTYWMQVIAGEPYYFVIRYYKPDVTNLPKKPC